MKKIILTATLLFVATITQAQKSLYEALEANGETAIYEGFSSKSANGNGTYKFNSKLPSVKIKLKKLITGQPVGFIANPVSKKYGGFSETEISDYGRVDSYPNVMSIKHDYTNDGYMMIDDLLLVVNNISDKGSPKLKNVTKVYVLVKENAAKKGKTKKKKKKLGGFLSRMKLGVTTSKNYRTATHKYLETINIEQKFNDYVTAMKAKQAKPLTSRDRADIAKIKRAREAGDEEIKRYNDSIKATPEYKDLQRRKKLNEENYKAAKAQNSVTLRNNSSKTIYVGKSHSANKGTEIKAGGVASWNCDLDAFIMIETIKGSTYSYKASKNKVYTANSGCGNTVNIN